MPDEVVVSTKAFFAQAPRDCADMLLIMTLVVLAIVGVVSQEGGEGEGEGEAESGGRREGGWLT